MATLPEALLLLALHDERGSLHPSAWLGIDHGLRGAVLAELRLKKLIQTRKGQARIREGGPTGNALLDEAYELLQAQEQPGEIGAWLTVLEQIEDIRAKVRKPLQDKGILQADVVDREHDLNDSVNYPMIDGRLEAKITASVHAATGKELADVSQRVGTLIALVVGIHLTNNVFDKDARKPAKALAAKVMEKDSISAEVQKRVDQTQGTWEM